MIGKPEILLPALDEILVHAAVKPRLFTLHADETVNVSGIPYDTRYELTEAEISGYNLKTIDKPEGTITGEVAIAVTVTNTKPAPKPKLAEIIVSKTLGDNVPETDTNGEKWSFDFKITTKTMEPLPISTESTEM